MQESDFGKINQVTSQAPIHHLVIELLQSKSFKKNLEGKFGKQIITTPYETNAIYYIFVKSKSRFFSSTTTGVFCYIISENNDNITVKDIDLIKVGIKQPTYTIVSGKPEQYAIEKTKITGVIPYSTIKGEADDYNSKNPNILLTCVQLQKEKVEKEKWLEDTKNNVKSRPVISNPSQTQITETTEYQQIRNRYHDRINEIDAKLKTNGCKSYLGGGKRRTNKKKKTIKRNKSKGKKSRRTFIN